MTIGKVLVAMLVVSTVTMALLENAEGGREMAMKEATTKPYPPQVLNENYERYKPKEDYECDGYKYKDKDCYEYGNCDKSPYTEDDDRRYNWSPYKKPMPKPKEMAGKYGVHRNFP